MWIQRQTITLHRRSWRLLALQVPLVLQALQALLVVQKVSGLHWLAAQTGWSVCSPLHDHGTKFLYSTARRQRAKASFFVPSAEAGAGVESGQLPSRVGGSTAGTGASEAAGATEEQLAAQSSEPSPWSSSDTPELAQTPEGDCTILQPAQNGQLHLECGGLYTSFTRDLWCGTDAKKTMTAPSYNRCRETSCALSVGFIHQFHTGSLVWHFLGWSAYCAAIS